MVLDGQTVAGVALEVLDVLLILLLGIPEPFIDLVLTQIQILGQSLDLISVGLSLRLLVKLHESRYLVSRLTCAFHVVMLRSLLLGFH